MVRRRRRKNAPRVAVFAAIAAVVLLAWWLYPDAPADSVRAPTPLIGEQPHPSRAEAPAPNPANAPSTRPAGAKPGSAASPGPTGEASSAGAVSPSRPASPTANSVQSSSAPRGDSVDGLVQRGEQALSGGDPITARRSWSEAVRLDPTGPRASSLREKLSRLADDTLFSGRILENDPLVERYVIRPGDLLAKIARNTKVSPELLARVNGIADVNRIRAGQGLKLVKGPFHAVVHKRGYVMDVYLQDTLVRSYPVGLGADDSTPRGQWRVGTRLVNPTYYPPRGGDIIAADDPKNPLGERWIGLIGVSGEALGQERYGIHGTIEPESIGTNNSLGCIRLHNKDVEDVYAMLVEEHSTVDVQ